MDCRNSPKSRPDIHLHQCFFHSFKGRRVHCCPGRYNAGAGIYHILGHIKDCHHNVKGVGNQRDRYKGFKNPFKKYPGFKIRQIIVVNNQLDQFITGDKGEDQARNRDDDAFRDGCGSWE